MHGSGVRVPPAAPVFSRLVRYASNPRIEFHPPPMNQFQDLPDGWPAQLVTVIDTEEEFDWSAAFDSANTSVAHMSGIHRFQEIFDDVGVVPVYVIDYPIASQDIGFAPLKEFSDDGRAVIGAHLHPWVSPPVVEKINDRNSYPGNLPRELEAKKLEVLTDKIEESVGVRPTIYKAGRYGTGPNTHDILEQQGYEVDISPSPPMDFRADGGPNFSRYPSRPCLIGRRRRLLCLPNTGAYVGFLGALGPALYPAITHRALGWARLPGIASRSGALSRIRLSPEGFSLEDMTTLASWLFARGYRVFVLSFHSPSVEPGHTPYVRNTSDLEEFLGRLRGFLEYFRDSLKGKFTTPHALKQDLCAPSG